MVLDLADDKFIIRQFKNELKPYQLSQLDYWGFQEEANSNSLILENNNTKLIPKIIEYLKNENIAFSLTDDLNILLSEINEVDNKFIELLESARSLKAGIFNKEDYFEHVKFVEKSLKRPLKDHQLKASFHLWLIKNGANFSVPGSGKTTVVLTIYEKLRLLNEVNNLFVIGPPSCFGPWREEFELVIGRKPSYQILAGGNRAERKSEYYKSQDLSELYLTTFQTLLNDQREVASFLSNEKIRSFLVIDEAHYIKQINGNWAKASLNIAKHSKYRCVLTGTPIPQSYSDLYNLFEFLHQDYSPITSEDKAELRLCEDNEDYDKASKILESKIGPLFYRVRKKELGLKPQVFIDPIKIQMRPYERKIYDAIQNKIRDYAREDYLRNIDVIDKLRRGRMMRLRQTLSYTKLLTTAIEDYTEDLITDYSDLKYLIYRYDELEIPAKLDELIRLIDIFKVKKEKVVIWSHFLGTIEQIRKTLLNKGHYCKKIIGETPIERATIMEEETRERIRNEFIRPDSGLDILIANPSACAESISLHKTCFNAVYYDLSYNCSQYLQSLDRIHRVGGSENQSAYYYYLQYNDTLEPDILNSLNQKTLKMYRVIENDYSIYSLNMFDDMDELSAYERIFLEKHGS